MIDRARLLALLAEPPPSPPEDWASRGVAAPRTAAVALPVVLDDAPRVYAVLRSASLRDHPGEVAFPGGKVEPSDVSPEAAALRELEEEVAVVGVTVLGRFAPLPVVTGKYLVHPFVVELPPGAVPRVACGEIEEVLTIALEPLLAREVRGTPAPWQGVELLIPSFRLPTGRGEVVLYGMSAFFLYELLSRVAETAGLPPPPLVRTTDQPWGDRYDRTW